MQTLCKVWMSWSVLASLALKFSASASLRRRCLTEKPFSRCTHSSCAACSLPTRSPTHMDVGMKHKDGPSRLCFVVGGCRTFVVLELLLGPVELRAQGPELVVQGQRLGVEGLCLGPQLHLPLLQTHTLLVQLTQTGTRHSKRKERPLTG